ncbi:MAG TPA: V-type ATPase subunit [Candidatus Sulfotelmatobacter sp.]|nr:V-type ATPase subunit [Candidatus Sulfotelmatobacter sp.]
MQAPTQDLDFLTARLQGRRNQLPEAQRLDELCRLQSIAELARATGHKGELQTARDFQRQLVQDLAGELSEILGHLRGTGARLLAWMQVRFQVENLKVLLRGAYSHTPLAELQKHLVPLPRDLSVAEPTLATASSPEQFVQALPPGPLRASMERALVRMPQQPRPFFLETALDRGYFEELLARAGRIAGEDKTVIQAMAVQEVDLFHLMLVVRGKFFYGLEPERLHPFHLSGTGISRGRFTSMLNAPDLLAAVRYAVGTVLERLPPERQSQGEAAPGIDPAAVETLAWNRFRRLANRAFRRSPTGLGLVIGYVNLRRVAVANLITLSEGLQTGTADIRARLIPRRNLEAAYV